MNTIKHEIALKKSNTSNSNNYRCIGNPITIKQLGGTRKTHIKGCDYADISSQYYKSILIANSAKKTYYVEYNHRIQKLKSVKSQLKHLGIKYYIVNNMTCLVFKDTNNIVYRLPITYTNGILIHNKLDKKQQKRIYA